MHKNINTIYRIFFPEQFSGGELFTSSRIGYTCTARVCRAGCVQPWWPATKISYSSIHVA